MASTSLTPPQSLLLTSKLRAPLPCPGHLARPRLLKLLAAGLKTKITLVDAPPGYGKTTLLTQWYQTERSNLPIAWVSLDEQDNDPVRLWAHVSEALRHIVPEELGSDIVLG